MTLHAPTHTIRLAAAVATACALFASPGCINRRALHCDLSPEEMKTAVQTRFHAGQSAEAVCAVLDSERLKPHLSRTKGRGDPPDWPIVEISAWLRPSGFEPCLRWPGRYGILTFELQDRELRAVKYAMPRKPGTVAFDIPLPEAAR